MEQILELLEKETGIGLDQIPYWDEEIYKNILGDPDIFNYISDSLALTAEVNCTFVEFCREVGISSYFCELSRDAVKYFDSDWNALEKFPYCIEELNEMKKMYVSDLFADTSHRHFLSIFNDICACEEYFLPRETVHEKARNIAALRWFILNRKNEFIKCRMKLMGDIRVKFEKLNIFEFMGGIYNNIIVIDEQNSGRINLLKKKYYEYRDEHKDEFIVFMSCVSVAEEIKVFGVTPGHVHCSMADFLINCDVLILKDIDYIYGNITAEMMLAYVLKIRNRKEKRTLLFGTVEPEKSDNIYQVLKYYLIKDFVPFDMEYFIEGEDCCDNSDDDKINTNLIEYAIDFASEAHSGMTRKGTNKPYITHPLETGSIVSRMTTDSDTIAAAYLHDTVEDTPITISEIEYEFGFDIADLVRGVSENKRKGIPEKDTWKIRKQETIDFLSKCEDKRINIIAFADKLSNMRDISKDYETIGNKLWERFNQKDPKELGWYYGSYLDTCEFLKDSAEYAEYKTLINKVFGMQKEGE